MNYQGLTQHEATEKLKQNGLNEIPKLPPTPWWKIFLHQFKDLVIIVLLIASVASFVIHEYVNSFFIIFTVVLNSLLGFYQELKAQKDISSLKKMITPECRVIRDGKEFLLPTKYLVLGDIVNLGTGDKVPADGELLISNNLLINEAILTGESLPINKTVREKVFLATTVLSGHGLFQVTETGVNTKFGAITKNIINIADEDTPLEKKIASFGKALGVLIAIVAFILFVVGIVQGRLLYEMFLQSVALAVAVIPEGLPTVITITLAVGTQRMAKQKAIIRKLAATEGLGSVQIICTDKTGTLTKNEMTVKKIWLTDNSEFEAEGVGYLNKGKVFRITKDQDAKNLAVNIDHENNLAMLMKIGILCNTASLVLKEDSGLEFDVLGDTTEGALLILAKKLGVNEDEVKENYKIMDELSFDSQKMMMTVLVKSKNREILMCKGAPEKIIENCKVGEEEKRNILRQIEKMGKEGLRVMGFAYKDEVKAINGLKNIKLEEQNLEFLGLVGIYDPPRDEVKNTLNLARKAGIRTVMLTGDNALTALKIAEEIGLVEKGEEVITGEQLNTYSEEVLNQKLDFVNVFARVTPLSKYKIVEAYQRKGLMVAVTGDGVNDAPALKMADVGVAMGKTGTDAAKEAADIIITDDNFSTIVKAIEEGRVIYDNIVKALKFLLSSNLGETLIVTFSLFLGWPIALIPQQILWINVVSDGVPALAMAVDPKDPYVMSKKPRDKKSAILESDDWNYIVLLGFIQAIIVLIVYRIALYSFDLQTSRLIVFTVLVFVEMIIAFVIRGRSQRLFNNKTLIISVLLTIVCQIVILTTPALRDLFSRV